MSTSRAVLVLLRPEMLSGAVAKVVDRFGIQYSWFSASSEGGKSVLKSFEVSVAVMVEFDVSIHLSTFVPP